MIKTDIAIIGLGITSKLAALALASNTRKVTIFGEENSQSHSSNLVTFFSLSSIDFLKNVGIENVVNQSVSIKEISCSKLEKYQLNNKFQINFKEKDEMGRVIINNNLSDSLDSQIKVNKNITILNNVKIKEYKDEGVNKILLLENEDKFSVSLLIITDKKSNLINENFKNNILKKDLKQTSIVMDVTTKTNHHAYQFFTKKWSSSTTAY